MLTSGARWRGEAVQLDGAQKDRNASPNITPFTPLNLGLDRLRLEVQGSNDPNSG